MSKNTVMKWASARERARVVNESLVSMASFESASASMDANTTVGNGWPDVGSVVNLSPIVKIYGNAGDWASEASDAIVLEAGCYLFEIDWTCESSGADARIKWAITENDAGYTWLDGSSSGDYFTPGNATSDAAAFYGLTVLELKEAQSLYLHVAAHNATCQQVRGSGSAFHITKLA